MRQVNLPLIPDSAIDLGSCFSVFFEKEYVTWFHGLNVINRHRRDDQNEYRLEIARLCANGSVKQSAMARATGLHKNTVMSYVGRLLSCGVLHSTAPLPCAAAQSSWTKSSGNARSCSARAEAVPRRRESPG